jgi:acyl carrier protein phosphodiesterase
MAPFGKTRLRWMETILIGYREPPGIQRALDSVAARLRRDNPVANALPALQMHAAAFAQEIVPIMNDLEAVVARIDNDTRVKP